MNGTKRGWGPCYYYPCGKLGQALTSATVNPNFKRPLEIWLPTFFTVKTNLSFPSLFHSLGHCTKGWSQFLIAILEIASN